MTELKYHLTVATYRAPGLRFTSQRPMRAEKPIRVAALVDLPRSPEAGGHVKCWERLAAAAADGALPLDLTVYFSGRHRTEVLGRARGWRTCRRCSRPRS